MKIAILDSDIDEVKAISATMTGVGHQCDSFQSSAELLRRFAHEPYALVIASLQNHAEKTSPVPALRKKLPATVPIICVTSAADEYQVMTTLDAGANDYLFSPIRRKELLTRTLVLLRKAYPAEMCEQQIQFGQYAFETGSGRLTVDGKLADVTRKEFDLALLLFRNLGRPLSRALIAETVWHSVNPDMTRTMDTHISRIRSKLGLIFELGYRLSPVYGYGYRLDQIKPFEIEDEVEMVQDGSSTLTADTTPSPRRTAASGGNTSTPGA